MIHPSSSVRGRGGLWFVLVVPVLLLLAACTPIQRPAPAAIPEITIEVSESGIRVPEVVPGGIVAITVENTGAQAHMPGLWRIRDGHTREDILRTMDDLKLNPDAFFAMFEVGNWIHYVNDLAPGASYRFYADLDTGEFFVTDDGSPDLPTTFFAATEVVGTVEPQAAVAVDMADFAYAMPDGVPAGKQWWEFTNSGEQWHLAAIIEANPNLAVEEIQAVFDGPGAPPADSAVAVVGGMPPMSPGERVWMEIELGAGSYELICPLPDVAALAAGAPPLSHLLHGMRRTFTVAN
jgi:hypothetical protein